MTRASTKPRFAPGSRRSFLINGGALITTGVVLGAISACQAQTPPASVIVVYKTPTCGCCTAWVEHVAAAGFTPRIVKMADLTLVRKKLNAPDDLISCHIAQIDGYAVEGHVPADAIKKLIAEKPDAVGIFVPGMPPGSPGMESPYGSQAFDVILQRRDGKREIFATYGS